MKILIIATPRSGSTVLTKSISQMLGYTPYHEPYNYSHPSIASQKFPKILPDNVVVKTMINQAPKKFLSTVKFYEDEIKKYDKVILLSRKNIYLAYESFNYKINSDPNGNWHKAYNYIESKFNLTLFNDYLQWTSTLIEFSLNSNTTIYWYEDLFTDSKIKTESVIKSWNLGGNVEGIVENFNPKYKYRVNTNKQTLI